MISFAHPNDTSSVCFCPSAEASLIPCVCARVHARVCMCMQSDLRLNEENGTFQCFTALKVEILVEHKCWKARETEFNEKRRGRQQTWKPVPGRAPIQAVMFRLCKIRININLVSCRLLCCRVKLGSLRFSAECLKLLRRVAHLQMV